MGLLYTLEYSKSQCKLVMGKQEEVGEEGDLRGSCRRMGFPTLAPLASPSQRLSSCPSMLGEMSAHQTVVLSFQSITDERDKDNEP